MSRGTVFRFGSGMKKESSEKLILPCTIPFASRHNEEIVQNDKEENRQSLHPVIFDFEQKSIQQDSEQMADQNQNEESLAETLDQVTTHGETE